jgi:hypothetical protein
MIKYILLFFTLIMLGGCSTTTNDDLVDVLIIKLNKAETIVEQDYTTYEIVSTGWRFNRKSILGEVGETIKLKRSQLNYQGN